jgi:PAS domain S-box-containing protein
MSSLTGDSSPADTSSAIGLMQVALDQSANGIIVYEAVRDTAKAIQSLRILLVNRRAEQFLGLSRTDMLGKTVEEAFPNSTTPTLWENMAHVIESGTSMRYEQYFYIRPTRASFWFDLTLEPVGDGQRVVVSFVDITEIRAAKQALLGDSILFRALSGTVPDMGVIVTDFFKKIIIANGVLPDLLQKTAPDDLIGESLETMVLPEFRDDWRNYLGTALGGEAHFFSDHWAGWRSEVYVGPVRNDLGVVVMLLVVFRNVTEQYRQQQALLQNKMALEQSNQSLEQFAYVASHDLQEPLRKIKSFGDILATTYGETLGGMGLDMIARMQSASDRMSQLIQSLLGYARLGSEQRSTGLVHLEDIFNDLISDLSVRIQERQGVVRLRPPLPILPGDESQLRQLFQNLLTNALKFVPPKRIPLITIWARVVEGPHVPGVAAAADAFYAEINVQDNGIGIDRANHEAIFGLFSRLNARQQFEGTGIGLATTKKVIENHRGSISLDSEVGVGSTFRVYLPTK